MPGNAELLERIVLQRDPEAFSELYDRHAPVLFGLACRILKSDMEAEDLLQEIFLSVWNDGQRYKAARGSVPNWLCLLTRSRAIDRLRRRKHREGLEVSSTPQSNDGDDVYTNEEAVGPDPEPLEELDTKERQAQVHETLAALPEAQRKVIELAYFEGLTHAEIAQALLEPLGTVKTRMRLAMLKLAEALGAYVNEPL